VQAPKTKKNWIIDYQGEVVPREALAEWGYVFVYILQSDKDNSRYI